MIDNANFWSLDKRAIVAARLCDWHNGDGIFLAADGYRFERFERNGEMAAIPYLRVLRPAAPSVVETVVEAPLRHFAWVEFEKGPRS